MKSRIMLSLMQLDIGGAETHVVELARELHQRGYYVVVTSNGGVYEHELKKCGIKHYRVPLQNKNPLNVYRAFGLLEKIIKDERIDIVHSHARIPSFILGRLQKKLGFMFVTTAHWVFSTKWGLKYITNWGEHAIAVSEDIKKYLMDNYNMPEADINVTINGIDTDKFSPDTDTDDIKKEFAIADGDFVVSYVSRMDEDRSLAARQLIECAEELSGKIPSLKILIAGGGDDFDNVSQMAAEVNHRVGRNLISLAGARTDINKIAAVGDVFVGVSRAALEAMACAKRVIIAGNEGYIGLFTPDKLDGAKETNFCCRGCKPSKPSSVLTDILTCYHMDADQRAALERFGRELILSDYSVGRMCDDTIFAYDAVAAKRKTV